ncbi:hypothetical protein [Chroococcus sp. FPU101]|uniref:hypothetical protein n=1 Tax=Chroococcus sp. FPU101 TaxID=1974212 RepID=UPI001A9046A6|nr:hypothetical protein [Chroococcus sp. FPU101]GFE69928.1 hypothetical protein CFPU101_25380 [Chroococcus sp. FPU101]
MNVRFQPLFVPSLLVILSAASFIPSLKAQDLTNIKPTSQDTEMSQTTDKPPMETEVTPSTTETQPSPNSNTTTNCQGKTPSIGQPGASNPTNLMNSTEMKNPMERGTNQLKPVTQPQPISPTR